MRNMKQIDLPLYIEVENGKVFALWYDDEDGLDRLLNEGSEYFISYRTIPEEVKQHMKEYEHEKSVNWLTPKVYKGEDKKEEEEDEEE